MFSVCLTFYERQFRTILNDNKKIFDADILVLHYGLIENLHHLFVVLCTFKVNIRIILENDLRFD